jgi:hypothetical protein
MSSVTGRQRGAGKAIAFVILILLAVIAGGYFWMQHRQQSAVHIAEATAQQQTVELRQQGEQLGQQLAQDIARTLAVTLYDRVSQGQTSALEAVLANIVRGHRIATIMVVDPQGKVVATTDLRYANRTLPEAEAQRLSGLTGITIAPTPPARDQVEADAPLQSGGERAGTVRVFVDVSPFASSATPTEGGAAATT